MIDDKFAERYRELCNDYYEKYQVGPPVSVSSYTRMNALLDRSKKPMMKELVAISEDFHVSINYLLTGDELYPSLHGIPEARAKWILREIEGSHRAAGSGDLVGSGNTAESAVFVPRPSKKEQCIACMKDLLRDGPMDSSELKKKLCDAGFSISLISKYRKEAGVISVKQPDKTTKWMLGEE